MESRLQPETVHGVGGYHRSPERQSAYMRSPELSFSDHDNSGRYRSYKDSSGDQGKKQVVRKTNDSMFIFQEM